MAEDKKTSVEWMGMEPYNNVLIDSYDGWVVNVKQEDGKVKVVRDLHTSFNIEEITEQEFRDRMKKSNARVPVKYVKDFTTPTAK